MNESVPARFRAYRVHKDDEGYRGRVETVGLDDLSGGDVTIRATYSGINYKDALAGTGKAPIMRSYPMVGGIDVAGIVISSESERFSPGDEVLVTGAGLSETRDGGYAEFLRLDSAWVTPLPPGLTALEAMTIGTAGFTAALSLYRMEVSGQRPDMGPILVTGATGGVGSIAVNMLHHLGYEVAAVSGKPALHDWLRSLGASRILGRDELPGEKRPLEKAVWGGAVDNVGGDMLAQITRTVAPWGNIASIGLAGGHELHTTVMPFILRGVSLLGCNSVDVPVPLRAQLWDHLAGDWRPPHLDRILTTTETLDTLPQVFERLLAGQVHGRALVEVDV